MDLPTYINAEPEIVMSDSKTLPDRALTACFPVETSRSQPVVGDSQRYGNISLIKGRRETSLSHCQRL